MPLVSCDKGDDQNNNNNPPSDEETVIDFEGADYTILARAETAYEVDNSGKGTDDKVQRKIWERNVYIKDTYNAIVEVVPVSGIWANRTDYIAAARAAINSGMNEYSMFLTHGVYIQNMAMEGLGLELSKLPQIDIDADWWCKDYNDVSTIDGKNYVFLGDIGITLYENLQVIFVNWDIAEKYHVEDLYQKVLDGNWTLDEMIRLSKVVDSAENPYIPEQERNYGLLSNAHSVGNFAVSLNLKYTGRGENGQRSFGTKPPKKLADVFETLRLWYITDTVKYGLNSSTDKESNPIFTEGRALFYTQILGEAKYMAANMEDEYGVIPYPKYEAGKDTPYYSTTQHDLSACLVPASVENTEMVGTVTEAMCKYGREHITYEYFETRLKLRYFDDYQTKAMLDLVRDGLSYEFTEVFGGIFSVNPYDSFENVMYKNIISPHSETLPFHWQTNAGIWRNELKTMYENFAKLD